MSNAFKQVVPGGKPLSSDLNQITLGLSSQIDVGPLSLFAKIAVPSAPTVATSSTSGVLNASYKYIQVFVTGWVGSDGTMYVQGFAPSAASASVSPVNQQVTVTLSTGPTGTIGRLLYRTAGGGSTYSFLAWVGNNTTTVYTDNVADASLGSNLPNSGSTPAVYGTSIPASVPTTNTTGTTLSSDYNLRSYTMAYANASLSLAANTFTRVPFNTIETDNLGEFNTSSAKFTASVSGLYHVDTTVYFSGTTSTAQAALDLYKNGAAYKRLGYCFGYQTLTGGSTVQLNSGDYLQVYATSSDTAASIYGSSSSANTWMSVIKIV